MVISRRRHPPTPLSHRAESQRRRRHACPGRLGDLDLLETAAFLLVATRYVFAFSFNLVLPIKLSDVSARFHFPLKASALNFVISCPLSRHRLLYSVARPVPELCNDLESALDRRKRRRYRPALPQEGPSVVLAWRTLESAAAFDCRGGVLPLMIANFYWS